MECRPARNGEGERRGEARKESGCCHCAGFFLNSISLRGGATCANVSAHRDPDTSSPNARRPWKQLFRSEFRIVDSARCLVWLSARCEVQFVVAHDHAPYQKINHQNLASSTASRLAPSQVPQSNQVPKYRHKMQLLATVPG